MNPNTQNVTVLQTTISFSYHLYDTYLTSTKRIACGQLLTCTIQPRTSHLLCTLPRIAIFLYSLDIISALPTDTDFYLCSHCSLPLRQYISLVFILELSGSCTLVYSYCSYLHEYESVPSPSLLNTSEFNLHISLRP